jgi:pimeloyl-ACP methyl ester carboxylesterase
LTRLSQGTATSTDRRPPLRIEAHARRPRRRAVTPEHHQHPGFRARHSCIHRRTSISSPPTTHLLRAGGEVRSSADGPLALCLHGFPDSVHTWRYLLPDLPAAGFRAVAPWMGVYAPTAVPADGSYGAGALAGGACALHEALGGDGRAVLIGHDWGAIAGTVRPTSRPSVGAAWSPGRSRRSVRSA